MEYLPANRLATLWQYFCRHQSGMCCLQRPMFIPDSKSKNEIKIIRFWIIRKLAPFKVHHRFFVPWRLYPFGDFCSFSHFFRWTVQMTDPNETNIWSDFMRAHIHAHLFSCLALHSHCQARRHPTMLELNGDSSECSADRRLQFGHFEHSFEWIFFSTTQPSLDCIVLVHSHAKN